MTERYDAEAEALATWWTKTERDAVRPEWVPDDTMTLHDALALLAQRVHAAGRREGAESMRERAVAAGEFEVRCWPPFDGGRTAMRRVIDAIRNLPLDDNGGDQ